MKRVLKASDLKKLSIEDLRAMAAEPLVSEFERTILLRELINRDRAAARKASMREGCEGLPEEEAFVCEVRNTLRILLDEFHEGKTTAAKAAWELANLTGIPYVYTCAVISTLVDVEHIENEFDSGLITRSDADTRMGLLSQDHLTIYRIVRHGNAKDIRDFKDNPGNYITTKKTQKKAPRADKPAPSKDQIFLSTFETMMQKAIAKGMEDTEENREKVAEVVRKVVEEHFSR